MEPLSALSVATAVTQFIEFTGTIISGTWKIYRSDPVPGGVRHEYDHIFPVTKRLTELTKSLRDSIRPTHGTSLSSQDEELKTLGCECVRVGEQLLSVLDSLKSQSKCRLWACFREALVTVWKQKDVDSLQMDLERYRRLMSTHILITLRERIIAKEDKQLHENCQNQKTQQETHDMCKTILRRLAPAPSWHSDVREEINRSYEEHSSDQNACAPPAEMEEILKATDVTVIQKRLMHHLRFRDIDTRYSKVTRAYHQTYEWIFRRPPHEKKWADFVQWINGDDPLYWITGKAGAGKSTLMRFIYDHERTQEAFRSWAAGDTLVMARFFFWNSGTEIQQSYEGLVRTLLYQLLDQMPGLIPFAFPRRVETGLIFSDHNVEEQPWTWEELLDAFRSAVAKATEITRIVFFIDGMDEFRGKPSELIEFIKGLVAPKVKICASSRPWIDFEDAFISRPHLRLEDLTYGDITHYITSKLNAQPAFRAYPQAKASQLIDNTCTKASGVFLWVFLVTESLIDGIGEREKLSELQKRLESLPSDLEHLFQKILDNLDFRRLDRASQLFQIHRASILPINLLQFSFADEDGIDLAMEMPCTTLSARDASSRAELMRGRIIAACRGLLDVGWDKNDALPTRVVNYLHRTVKDYFERPEIWAKVLRATDEGFNPDLRLATSYIMQLKTQDPHELSRDHFLELATYGIEYAIRADPACSTVQISLLDEIRDTTKGLGMAWPGLEFSPLHRIGSKSTPAPVFDFLQFAVRCGLDDYVRAKLRIMTSSELAGCLSELLYCAVQTTNKLVLHAEDRPAIRLNQAPSRSLVKSLLDYGADPNFAPQRFAWTSWKFVLAHHSTNQGINEEFLLRGVDARLSGESPKYFFLSKEIKNARKKRKREEQRMAGAKTWYDRVLHRSSPDWG